MHLECIRGTPSRPRYRCSVQVVPKPLLQKARSLVAQRDKVISMGYTVAEADVDEENDQDDVPMMGRFNFAAYVLRKESRWKEARSSSLKDSIITRYEQARIGEMPERCEGRHRGRRRSSSSRRSRRCARASTR